MKTASKAKSFRYLRRALRAQLNWTKAYIYKNLDLDMFVDEFYDQMIDMLSSMGRLVKDNLKQRSMR